MTSAPSLDIRRFIDERPVGRYQLLVALLCGLCAAALFLFQRSWRRPLFVGALAVAALVVLTFVQPPVWTRLLLNVALLSGVWWAYQHGRERRKRVTLRATEPAV